MPNGGSDCCGTCWFNRINGGEQGSRSRGLGPNEDFCEIRDTQIADPFYTYCANHPHRRPNKDTIPIGPITVHVGGGLTNDREIWKLSPDTEEIRLHLIQIIGESLPHIAQEDRYPIGDRVLAVAIWQLGQFRERRALRPLEWIRDNLPGLAGHARAAIKLIESDD